MADRPIAYVASQTLPPEPPPPATTGAMGWMRENLFSSVTDTIMTVISIIIIVWAVDNILAWALLNSVWNADSLNGCRAVWDEIGRENLYHPITGEIWASIFGASEDAGGHGGPGACWAVIVDRFDQFIYGFYPMEERWRPTLAFVLLLVAIAYVLFDRMPYRQYGLLFAAAMPVIGYWLIWGGSIWLVPLILVGLWLGYLAFQAVMQENDPTVGIVTAILTAILVFLTVALVTSLILSIFAEIFLSGGDFGSPGEFGDAVAAGRWGEAIGIMAIPAIFGLVGAWLMFGAVRNNSAAAAIVAGILVAIIWIAVLMDPLDNRLIDNIGHFGLVDVESRQIGGFLLAIILGVTGIALSLPIGILLALGRRSNMIFFQTICIGFIEFIRGVPLITLLFIANAVLAYFFPPGSNIDLVLRVIIMITLFASAYMAEVVRGGLAALPQGQYEAADALGLNYWQSMRQIILPQALKISIPNIVSLFIGLFKDTTLVVVIGLLDPIGLIQAMRASPEWNGLVWEFYIFVGLVFFIFCFSMSRYSMYLERKLATDRR